MAHPNNFYFAGVPNPPPYSASASPYQQNPYQQAGYPYGAGPTLGGPPQQAPQHQQYTQIPYGLPPPTKQYAHPSQGTNQNSPGAPVPTQVFILTPTTLLVSPGQPISAMLPYSPELVPGTYPLNGLPLPVYGPLGVVPRIQAQTHPAKSSPKATSKPVSKPTVTPIDKAVPWVLDPPHKPEVIYHMLSSCQSHGSKFCDPHLSSIGDNQCSNLVETFPYSIDVRYVFCSPFERTMALVDRGFPDSASTVSHRPAIIWPGLRSCADKLTSYNTGKPLRKLQTHVSMSRFDYGLLCQGREDDTWAVTHGKERAQEIRGQLHELAKVVLKGGKWKDFEFAAYTGKRDVHIVILSHSKFLHHLTQMDLLPKSELSDPAFKDGQFRSYRFSPAWAIEKQGLEKLRLYETSGSKARKYAAEGKCVPDPIVVETTDY